MTHIGKYQLVKKLASGGMAEVFLAKAAGPMGFEKTLVLKRILPHLAEDPQFVAMFLGEAKLVAQLNHPNIVQIFDFGEFEGAYYLAMEYIDGPSLRTLLKNARGSGTALPAAYCAKIVSNACEGLAFAHDFVEPATGQALNLIHRDISPDNILLSRQGAVKVVDFGIAKSSNQDHKTQTGQVKGKIAYMPPEQLQAMPLDRRVDVYALGVVLYELLTGSKPFEATTDASIMRAILFEPLVPAAVRRPDLHPALLRILDRALAKDRDNRYPDCHAFHAELEAFILSMGEPVGSSRIAQWMTGLAREGVSENRPEGSGSARTVQARPLTPRPTKVPIPPKAPTVVQDPIDVDVEDADLAQAFPRRRYRGVMALGGLALLAAGSGFVLFRQGSTQEAGAAMKQPSSVPGGNETQTRPPNETSGKLKFLATPSAVVFLDEKQIGETPLEVDLPPGKHRVRLFNADLGRKAEQTIEVQAGRRMEIEADLTRAGY